MKLSHRDRVLLTIVLVAVVWIVGVWFFIIPAFQELGDKRDELNKQQVELSKLNDKIEKDKDLPKRIEDAYKESEVLAKSFYTMQTTQNATNTVDKLLDEQKIVNSTMSISEYTIKTLKPFYLLSNAAATDFDTKVDQYEKIGASSSKSDKSNNSGSGSNPNIPSSITNDDGSVFTIDPNVGVVIGSYDIEFAFKGKYGDLQKFCEKLTKNEKVSMVLSTLSITDVNAVEEAERREAERNSKDNGGVVENPESKTDDKKGDKEKDEFNYDDKVVEGTVTINLMLIKKLSKPSF